MGAEDKVFSQATRPSGSPTFVSLFIFLPYATKSLLISGIVRGGSSKNTETYSKLETHYLVRE